MKYVPNIATLLAIALTGFCAATAEAADNTIQAFEAGGPTASWVNESGHLVLLLNGGESEDGRSLCGTKTNANAWKSTAKPPSAFEFDLNSTGKGDNSLDVVVEGQETKTDGGRSKTRLLTIRARVKAAQPGWRHVTLTRANFVEGNAHANDITGLYISNQGTNMLKNFTLNGKPFDINMNTDVFGVPYQLFPGQPTLYLPAISF